MQHISLKSDRISLVPRSFCPTKSERLKDPIFSDNLINERQLNNARGDQFIVGSISKLLILLKTLNAGSSLLFHGVYEHVFASFRRIYCQQH